MGKQRATHNRQMTSYITVPAQATLSV